ncbi:hypothetical protein PSCICN_09270 [Pseudomonas cichorii]|nr:hypothetical protein PSCICN_09270 [Pseudomonas cichorii]
MFVGQQGAETSVGFPDTCFYLASPQLQAQWQGIDKHPKGTIRPFAAIEATHQYRAEHHIVTATGRAQHLPPGQVMQGRHTDSELAGLCAQSLAQLQIQRQVMLFDTAAFTLHFMQAERQRRLFDIPQHVAKERLMSFTISTQSRLSHIVAIRDRLAQMLRLAQQISFHLMTHHLQCGVVHDHVMEQQQGHPALGRRILGIGNPHQRCLTNIHTVLAGIETRLQLAGDIALRRIQLKALHTQSGLTPDHLHRFVQSFPEQRGAQDIVTFDHSLQRAGKGIQPVFVIKAENRLQHVRVALFGSQMVIENPFLQWRQRVNVLDIGRAARNGSDDLLKLILADGHQRQHFRRDLRAARFDQVGRYADFSAAAHCGSQSHQGWLAK